MPKSIVSRPDLLTMQGIESVARFAQTSEAGLVKSYLESHDIQCVIYDSVLNAVWGGCMEESRIRLFVNETQLEEARKLLKEGGFESFQE